MSHASATPGRPPTPRQRRRESNLARILDGAMDLVVAGGFDALSMHKLARALDYTPGALYRYFASKDALIAALTTRLIQSFAGVLERTSTLVPGDAHLQRVLLALFTYRDLARHAPNRFGLLSLLLADPRLLVPDEEEAASPRQAMSSVLMPLVLALREAVEAGALDVGDAPPASMGDAGERSVILFASVHGLLQLRKQEARVPVVADLDRLVVVSLRSLLLGWGADPTTLSADLDAITALGDLVDRVGGLDPESPS
ncbi:MAG: TetR/AcrR family transcriptional regulator [Deltaproteobacteria bacterium]|nr:TetR/AcrR family transcriptional regulator [Deltaproteobacteria bacterium]